MANFAAGLKSYAQRTSQSLDDATIEVCTKLSLMVIKKTPVDSGRARSNWYPEINKVSRATSETRSVNEAISDAISTAQSASGSIFTLTNNLPYSIRLEYGWSKQAPSGMVRTSIAEIIRDLK
jgi:hypothetical protein